MVLMKHEIIGDFDGAEERHDIEFVLYGDACNGFSAMAKSVGYTCGFAVRTLLDKGFEKQCGIVTPTTKDVYQPLLEGLESVGLTWKQTVS